MKKNLLSGVFFSFKSFGLFLCLLTAKQSFSQSDGDLRVRISGSGYGAAATFQKYSTATGAWTTSDVVPTATTNVLIRDGITQTSNGTGYVAGTLTIGEGNAAAATASITGGAVTGVTITDPGKLIVIPGVTFIGPATTTAVATVTSVNVTGTSFNDQGSGYTTATVAFAAAPTGGTTATGTAVITGGKITGITVTDPGSGYTTVPAITITGDGTGANYSSLVGVQAITISNGGSDYTTPPTIMLGSAMQVGNNTTARTITVSGDVTFRKGASILSGSTSTSLTSTLAVGGNLIAETPVSFITQVPTSTSSTTVSFTKTGTATVSGAAFTFRNISLSGSTVLQINSSMNIAGTIALNTTGQIDASNGGIGFITYPTALAQTIAAATFKDGLIRNLTINNTAGVTLNQNLSVTNSLTMQSGLLTLPATPIMLQLNAANPIVGTFGATSHINTASDAASGALGMVQINNVTASRVLPLGNGGNYLPVTVNPSTTSTFTASVFTGATDNGTPNGTAIADKSNIVDAIYNINRTGGTGNCQLVLGFPASLKGSGFASIQNNQLGISHYNGATWDVVTGNGDNTQNFATATFNNFSPFRVAVNLNPTALPIKLGDITATKANGQTVLNWKVYTEVNASRYTVERSSNGFTFSEIGSANANGGSSYTLIDYKPVLGNNFYRLKAIDKDNAYTYSKVLLVDFSGGKGSLSISPNPVSHGFFTVRFGNLKAGKVSAKLYSTNGQLIMDQPIDYNGSTDNQLINLPSKVSKGIYQLVITDGANSQKTSVVVQ